jgi:F-type H+-transporting ATPase subunit alpha
MTELYDPSGGDPGRTGQFVQSYEPGAASREEVGRVTDAGDGIAHVEGLPSAMTNELLQFEDGTLGIALNLDVHEIGVVVLGDFAGIEEGQEVKRTGEVLSVPVGDAFLGRVVNPLGSRSTASARSPPRTRRALELQAPTSCSASRCTSRCRPASRPSTP